MFLKGILEISFFMFYSLFNKIVIKTVALRVQGISYDSTDSSLPFYKLGASLLGPLLASLSSTSLLISSTGWYNTCLQYCGSSHPSAWLSCKTPMLQF